MFKRFGNFIKRFFGLPLNDDPRLSKENKVVNSYFVDMDENYRRRTAAGLQPMSISIFEEKDH